MLRYNNTNFGLRHANQSYVIGFILKQDAHYVAKTTHSATKAQLRKGMTRDVSLDVLGGLYDRGMFVKSMPPIIIDENAELVIDKKININKLPCQVSDISFSEFIMLPFQHSIGVILPVDLVDETKETLIYQAQVIEPCYNVDLFRYQLSKK